MIDCMLRWSRNLCKRCRRRLTVPRAVLAGPVAGAESVQTPEKTWAAVERSAADRAAADIGEAIVEHNILQKH